MGVGALKPDRAIRDPVTIIASASAASVDAVAAVVSWACAGSAIRMGINATPAKKRLEARCGTLMLFTMSPLFSAAPSCFRSFTLFAIALSN
ncbi:MAG: hypothetical protein ACOYLS_11315 [Polymorphobacter sp.]